MPNPTNTSFINTKNPRKNELWLLPGLFTKNPTSKSGAVNLYDLITNTLIADHLINDDPCCSFYAVDGEDRTPVAINTTAAATLPVVLSGIQAAYITSTSAAAVSLQLDTATNYATQLGAVAGSTFDFIIDNSAGANTVTVVLGAGIVTGTVVVTGQDTLTVSTANRIGWFRLFFNSATAATLRRIT